MKEYRKSSHSVYDIKYHVIWTTKYRYQVLRGAIAQRAKDLIIQGCQARNIAIIKGSVGKDHIHVLLSCPPILSPAKIMQYLKGRSSRLLQEEFPELKRRYWGQHLWSRGYFCATVGSVTEEMIKSYIENQGKQDNQDFKIEQ
jgi:putative transposase